MGDWGIDKVGYAIRNQAPICEVNDIVHEAIPTSGNVFNDKFTSFHSRYVTMIWPWPVFATYHMICYRKAKKPVFSKGSLSEQFRPYPILSHLSTPSVDHRSKWGGLSPFGTFETWDVILAGYGGQCWYSKCGSCGAQHGQWRGGNSQHYQGKRTDVKHGCNWGCELGKGLDCDKEGEHVNWFARSKLSKWELSSCSSQATTKAHGKE